MMEMEEDQMLKKIVSIMVALSMLLCLTACGGETLSDETAESQNSAPESPEPAPDPTSPEYHSAAAIQERGVLVVGAGASNKMTYVVPDDPETYGELAGTRDGYVPELCRKIAEGLGVEIEFVEYGSVEEMLGAAAAGDVDITAANFEITEERLASYEMTDSIDVMNVVGDEIFLSTNPESGASVQSEDDLVHVRIGAVKGSAQAENAVVVYPEAEIVELATNEDVLAALAAGQVDAAVFSSFDRAFADQIVQEIVNGTVAQSGWEMVDPTYLGLGLVLMKGNEDLCQCINGMISDLTESGWLVECYENEEQEAIDRGIA